MDILLKRVKVIDPASPHRGQIVDIRIVDGIVDEIGNLTPKENEEVIEKDGMHISPGWIDLHADFADPGGEDREDIESGVAAAIFGGFTGAVVMPSTQPIVDQKGGIEYVLKTGEHLPFHLYPAGAISRGLGGNELAEMYDMWQSGALCFTDDQNSFSNTELLKLALQYVQNIDVPLFVLPHEPTFSRGAQMSEGKVSTLLGMRGMPYVAEVMQIERDLQLLRYVGGHLHFMGISSAESVTRIGEAKAEGLKVTADVNISNLVDTDDVLANYDTHYKLFPPLRTEMDRKALVEGVRNGTIDAVSANHRPRLIEEKDCEFENASFGAIGFESCFGLLGQTGLSVSDMVSSLSIIPRAILGLDPVVITEGQLANFTLFDPEKSWTFSRSHIQSKSSNTPYIGRSMRGRAIGVVVDDMAVIQDTKLSK